MDLIYRIKSEMHPNKQSLLKDFFLGFFKRNIFILYQTIFVHETYLQHYENRISIVHVEEPSLKVPKPKTDSFGDADSYSKRL